MKKTISLVLAVLFAAIAVCTLAISAFAAPEASTTTTTNDDKQGPTDPTTATTAAATTTTTAAATTTTTASDKTTTSAGTTETTKVADVTKTNPNGQTNYVDPDEKITKATTKKAPAKVDSSIPSTGSEILVPAVALLALAAGTVAVVKTKKDN
ncbi:unknown [Clostridium sp. CAG:413]|nr:unknown [Clostridium sp. CAG:413]